MLWENNQPKLRLVESKASRKDRTYHRVQVALYQMLVRQLIKDNPITINRINLKLENIECVVVRIDENTNKSQDILQSEALNLDMVEADINRLIASDGALKRIVETDLANLDYQLDQKCSDCTLSVHCLAESARERRLELLGIDSSIVTALHKADVKSINDLADLDLTGSQVAHIQQDISFTDNLELLTLKAQTRRRTLPGGDCNPDTYEVQVLPNYSGGQSQLPEHTINGERLIRVYLSVEYDYVENRIGALAAHVTKSEGKLDPKFEKNEDGKWQPDPKIQEYIEEGHDDDGKTIYKPKEIEGKDVIKFKTSAIATFLRILARRSAGDIVLVTAHTHTAVDNLLLRLDSRLLILRQQAENLGITVPGIQLSKVHSSQVESPTGGNVQDFPSKSCVRKVTQMLSNNVLVIGGTTSAILKMVDELNSKTTFTNKYPQGFQTTTLIVDEASMMVFPHFLALATLVKNDGEIMLAGDHRQLAPIITHDWKNEDRPPVLLYQPYVSAYQAIQNLKENADIKVSEQSILRSALSFTFRLPPVIREVIARLYRQDNIELQGQDNDNNVEEHEIQGTWVNLLQENRGLYLVLHSERESKRSNQLEVEIIKNILDAGDELSDGSTAILTPHRAQRSLLRTELENYYGNAVDVIDTVEKVQGGERDNVIVSAAASNPSAIGKNVEFILSLNRSNVAFSRVKKRLIVVCSQSLLDYIPTELDNYEEAILWKALRSECFLQMFTEIVNGHQVQVFTPPETTVQDYNDQ